jgi:2-keto-3-deoxy-L-rhamnonate aldolase RhmA
MYRPNALKARLAAGKKALGCWIHMASPIATEVLALTGYDFLLIDNEHAPASLNDSVQLLQAMSATHVTSMMRVPWNDPVYLKRALDIGVESVMIPAIDTAEQATQAVRACRYPPAGFRGSAYPVVRAASYGIGAPDYRETAADNLVIILQIESARAVENIEAIAAVDGIDVLLIGPNDLAGTIGQLGHLEHPDVMRLVERAERAIKASGKKLGSIAFGGRTFQEMFDHGYDLIAASTDMTLMREAALAEVRAHRQRNG